jgi:hypothetical protein
VPATYRAAVGWSFLHVFQQNADARAFYERHGFTVLDTSDGDRNMENLPDMTLRWTRRVPGLADRVAQPRRAEVGRTLPGPGTLQDSTTRGGGNPLNRDAYTEVYAPAEPTSS